LYNGSVNFNIRYSQDLRKISFLDASFLTPNIPFEMGLMDKKNILLAPYFQIEIRAVSPKT